MKNVPVYLFTGFLGAGKTRFIQSTLQDPSFNDGTRTLLLLCEDGEEEYDPTLFAAPEVYIEAIDSVDGLTPENLSRLLARHDCGQVMVEYNGMWLLDELYGNLPEGWLVGQEFFFADATDILTYNANMRNLVADKLKSCELAVFNRFPAGADKMPYHKLVRGLSRRSDIAYEYAGGKVEYDDIQDPLPFDVNAPVIDVGDDAYALWYRDLTEQMSAYGGKTVRVKGRLVKKDGLGLREMLFGRQVMTCCVEDIQFAGLVCKVPKTLELPGTPWVTLTADIAVKKHPAYRRNGPVLTATRIDPADAPEQEVATFY